MKKLIIALFASFLFSSFAYSVSEPEIPNPTDPGTSKPHPSNELAQIERLIAEKKEWAERNRFSEEESGPNSPLGQALARNEREIKDLEARLESLTNRPEIERPKPFPLHWGRPPEIQTTDHVELPGGFGMGSSSLAHWIKENIAEDMANGIGPGKPEVLTDQEKLDPRKFEAEVLKEAKEGTISREDAKKKLDALRAEMEKRGEFKRPKRPQKPELSTEVKNKLKDIKSQQDALAKEMKTKLDSLKKDGATREEMRKAVHAFQKDNKERLEAIKDAHKEIHQSLKDARPKKPERPELTADIKAKVEVLKEKQKELHTARKDLHENLKDKSKEDREALIADFKEANKAKHEEIKAKAKEVKEEIRALVETEATRTSDL